MNINLNIKDLIINPKTLEIIAREMGEMDNGYNLISLLTSCGVNRGLIEYPNTKWRMLYSVFCYLAKKNNIEGNKILLKIIEKAIHPLTHEGEKEISQKYLEKFNELLSFDDFYIKNNKIIKRAQAFTRKSSDNLNLYIKKKVLLEKWRDDSPYPIIEFSFNKNTVNEIFHSLSLIEKNGSIEFGVNNFPEDILTEVNDGIFLNWEVIQYMEKNSEIVNNSYGIEIEICEEDKLKKEIEEEIAFFKNNKKKYASNDIDIEWDTNNSYSYKKQKEIIIQYLYKLYSEFENINLLIVLNEARNLNIDVFRCLLALEMEGFIEINGIKNNKEFLFDDDNIYIKISLLKTNIFKNVTLPDKKISKKTKENKQEPILVKLIDSTINVRNDSQKNNNLKFPFKLPAGTTWQNFIIKFVDNKNIHIKVQGIKHTANHKDFGLIGKGKNKPEGEPWVFFKILANLNGELSIKDSEVRDKYKKQKEILSKALKNYFSIDSDPFYPYKNSFEKEGNSYKARFTLFTEENIKKEISEAEKDVSSLKEDKHDNNNNDFGVKEYLRDFSS